VVNKGQNEREKKRTSTKQKQGASFEKSGDEE